MTATASAPVRWAKLIDHTHCIGCHACSTACKSENEVPLGVHRTYVKSVDVGTFPLARRAFQVTRCNQCESAPCVTACPTSAMYVRADAIVDFDKSVCIGCKACMAACPYDAIFINPNDHAAEKCNFCAHRLDVGLEPACVVVCPTEAILVGDLNDPSTRVAHAVGREVVSVRRPEKETLPKLFYKGAHQATLDPLAARRPAGGLFMWSEQGTRADGRSIASGHPGGANSSASALLSWDVPHAVPWDWKVSLYTVTKGVASGAYLVAAALFLFGVLGPEGALWRWGAPLLAGFFLALTGALLIWDLEHPERFHLIFTRPQWSSWLAKGAAVITGYGAVLALHLVSSLVGWGGLRIALVVPGLPLAGLAAVYTAYLFAQAKARDLWQSRLLPVQLLVEAALGGAASLLLVSTVLAPEAVRILSWTTAVASLVQLLLVWGETTMVHVTAHARLGTWEMTAGRYRVFFWSGIVLMAAGTLSGWLGPWAAPLALAGLLAFKHAYVQAAQAVPLA